MLQIAKALLHRVHVEVAQLAISQILREQIADLAAIRLTAGIHLGKGENERELEIELQLATYHIHLLEEALCHAGTHL